MVKKAKKHNTIFADVSRTMVQKMPQLLIPVINEVFGTNYSYDVPFEQLRNEHAELFGKVITDSIIKIDSHIYHIECQSTDDNTMVLRMIEYDFAMGGKVLELESERLQKLAKNNTLFNLVKNGKLSISDAADEISISDKEFLDNMKKAGYDISSLSINN